ncbi:hypothetical protein BH10CYA1_BH10CYA1_47340 [soil metagenome]
MRDSGALLECLKQGDISSVESYVRSYSDNINELIAQVNELAKSYWSPDLSILAPSTQDICVEPGEVTKAAVVRICVFSIHSCQVLRLCTDPRLPTKVLYSPRLKGMINSINECDIDPAGLMVRIGILVSTPAPVPPMVVIQAVAR